MSLNWILIIIGALLILLEVILGAVSGFDLLLIGSAILLGGVLGVATKSASIGLATGGILALVYVFLGRKKIRSRLARHNLPSNTDALIGRTVEVTEVIAPHRPGRIRFEGEEWRAELVRPGPGAIEPGRSVRIQRIDGVTAFVEPVEGATGGAGS